MSKFDETVARLARSPGKMAMLSQLPGMLHKQANTIPPPPTGISGLFQRALGSEGAKLPAQITKDVLTGALTAAGGYGAARLMTDADADLTTDKAKQRFSTLGKLEAEQRFRNSQIKKLRPIQDQTYSELLADPIIAKADPALMQSAYGTMRRFAPTLASDPNAARAFLQESALYGKGPSYATLKTLADTEGSVLKTYHGGD